MPNTGTYFSTPVIALLKETDLGDTETSQLNNEPIFLQEKQLCHLQEQLCQLSEYCYQLK
jgi:hypothetical protein